MENENTNLSEKSELTEAPAKKKRPAIKGKKKSAVGKSTKKSKKNKKSKGGTDSIKSQKQFSAFTLARMAKANQFPKSFLRKPVPGKPAPAYTIMKGSNLGDIDNLLNGVSKKSLPVYVPGSKYAPGGPRNQDPYDDELEKIRDYLQNKRITAYGQKRLGKTKPPSYTTRGKSGRAYAKGRQTSANELPLSDLYKKRYTQVFKKSGFQADYKKDVDDLAKILIDLEKKVTLAGPKAKKKDIAALSSAKKKMRTLLTIDKAEREKEYGEYTPKQKTIASKPSQAIKRKSKKQESLTEAAMPQKFSEVVAQYNEYGKVLGRTHKMKELAERLRHIAETSEKVLMSEADDWFDSHVVKRDVKGMKLYANEFAKIAAEADVLHERATAIYDDMGHLLQRYFEVHDIDPNMLATSGDNVPRKPTSHPSRQMHETAVSIAKTMLNEEQLKTFNNLSEEKQVKVAFKIIK